MRDAHEKVHQMYSRTRKYPKLQRVKWILHDVCQALTPANDIQNKYRFKRAEMLFCNAHAALAFVNNIQDSGARWFAIMSPVRERNSA